MSMTSYVPETTARDLPMLPVEPWVGEDTDNELFDPVTAAVELPLEQRDRNTVPGISMKKGKSARRLPLQPDASTSTPAPLPAAPPLPSPRLPLPAEPSVARPLPRPPGNALPIPSTPRAPNKSGPPQGKPVAGRYEILDRIGQGGMGKVYKVSHTQLGKVFALKVIGENLADTEDARELFYREARMASSVNHPNITSVVDFGEDADLGAFMVMELVEGEPLAKMLHRETRLGVRVACEIILQVADALHYVHGKGIVHCDIKTENLLVSEQQGTKRRQMIVKLLDFGLARSLASGRGSGPLSGTPHYVAPERIRGDAASPSSDIYALGILFYEIVTGHVPWDGPVSQILHGHLEVTPTPPSKLVPGGLDPALENLILHALAKEPAKRHRDMAAFIYELRTVMDMLGFGRRGRRGGGVGKRVVIERSKNERDALVSRAFESCRLPLALVTGQGLVLVANSAFGKFVMGVSVEVEGLTVQSTPLAGAWEAFESDLAKAIGGAAVRRILEIEVEGRPRQRLLMWLDPAGEGSVLLGVQPIEIT
ncbi:MAG TPA: serine/threonine-protein kinase [Kofleriaceae bacterium]|nr:serine/threonine-protein kinase [Kofleriaceae bacterium]